MSIPRAFVEIPIGAKWNVFLDFVDQLVGNDLLTGTPTVTEVSRALLDAGGTPITTSNGWTIDNKAVNPSSYTIEGGERRKQTVKVGQAVTFRADSSAVALGRYAFKISCGTNNSSAETLIGYLRVNVVGA